MGSKPLFAAALVALSLGLAACGDSGSDSSSTEAETAPSASEEATAEETESTESEPAPSGEAAKSEKVNINVFLYFPDPVKVQVGGKVIWQNMDSVVHTATAKDGSFDTGPLKEGKIGSATFKEAGTFAYYCKIHPTIKGTVEVVE